MWQRRWGRKKIQEEKVGKALQELLPDVILQVCDRIQGVEEEDIDLQVSSELEFSEPILLELAQPGHLDPQAGGQGGRIGRAREGLPVVDPVHKPQVCLC